MNDEKKVNLQPDVALIESILNNQKLTIAEHRRVQEAWHKILETVNDNIYGIHVLDPVQPSQ